MHAMGESMQQEHPTRAAQTVQWVFTLQVEHAAAQAATLGSFLPYHQCQPAPTVLWEHTLYNRPPQGPQHAQTVKPESLHPPHQSQHAHHARLDTTSQIQARQCACSVQLGSILSHPHQGPQHALYVDTGSIQQPMVCQCVQPVLQARMPSLGALGVFPRTFIQLTRPGAMSWQHTQTVSRFPGQSRLQTEKLMQL